MKLDKISNQFESMMHDLPAGKMKHLEVEGKEIAIANINGKLLCVR
jgi:hypothetical protein